MPSQPGHIVGYLLLLLAQLGIILVVLCFLGQNVVKMHVVQETAMHKDTCVIVATPRKVGGAYPPPAFFFYQFTKKAPRECHARSAHAVRGFGCRQTLEPQFRPQGFFFSFLSILGCGIFEWSIIFAHFQLFTPISSPTWALAHGVRVGHLGGIVILGLQPSSAIEETRPIIQSTLCCVAKWAFLCC